MSLIEQYLLIFANMSPLVSKLDQVRLQQQIPECVQLNKNVLLVMNSTFHLQEENCGILAKVSLVSLHGFTLKTKGNVL